MPDIVKQIAGELKRKLEAYEVTGARYYTVSPRRYIGDVTEAGDGVALVEGPWREDIEIGSQELVEFQTSNGPVRGIAVNIGETERNVKEKRAHPYLDTQKIIIGAATIMGDYKQIRQGTKVYATGERALVRVGSQLVGRVINALGEPLDGKGAIKFEAELPVEAKALSVIARRDVDIPVQTGIKAIDAMVPIGRGQRELIIGDRQTGKTAIAIDTIINQKGKKLVCIYVAIGQKKAAIARTVALLERYEAMQHTVVVSASADDSIALQYMAPYMGCAIGEYFMEKGQDALVVYDDLSKHAWAYRQVALLLRRPPGREAYPGDLFYLHSRLLERAARRADEYALLPADFGGDLVGRDDKRIVGKIYGGPRAREDAEAALAVSAAAKDYKVVKVEGSGGSLTALPIIETLLGDVSAYIPTNVISITDGQIYLESNLFNAGIRPAINVGISVSRVGGDAQTKAMKQVAGKLRLDMAAYRELAAFALMSSDLDKSTQAQLTRGQRMQEILKQPQYEPMPMEHQVLVIFAGTNGYADNVPVEHMEKWEADLIRYLTSSYPELVKEVAARKEITPETESKLHEVLEAFKTTW